MKIQSYLRAKEALIISAELGRVLEETNLTVKQRDVLLEINERLITMFFDTYRDGREIFEPEAGLLTDGSRVFGEFYGRNN